jgi:hypothetical protein
MTQLSLFEGIENKEFLEYHKTNPHLYEAFKQVAFDAMKMGFKTYGANGIFEIIRWKRAEQGDGEFKINNNYAPLFARLFANEFPAYADFFRFRKSKFTKYVETLPKEEKTTHEIVFPYEKSLIVLKVTPTEDDYWCAVNFSDPANGMMYYFDVHYSRLAGEISVYVYNGKNLTSEGRTPIHIVYL